MQYTIDIDSYAGAHIQGDPSRRGECWLCLHFTDVDAAGNAQNSLKPIGQTAPPSMNPELQASMERGRAFIAAVIRDIPPDTPPDRVRFVVVDENGNERGVEVVAPTGFSATPVDADPTGYNMDADTTKLIRELTAERSPILNTIPDAPPAANFLGPRAMTTEEALNLLKQSEKVDFPS